MTLEESARIQNGHASSTFNCTATNPCGPCRSLAAAFRKVARKCAMIADMAEKPEEAGTLIRQRFGLEE